MTQDTRLRAQGSRCVFFGNVVQGAHEVQHIHRVEVQIVLDVVVIADIDGSMSGRRG
jgi:hypothetical protein